MSKWATPVTLIFGRHFFNLNKKACSYHVGLNPHGVQVEEGGADPLQVLRPLGGQLGEGRVTPVLGRQEGGRQLTQLLAQLAQAPKQAEPPDRTKKAVDDSFCE